MTQRDRKKNIDLETETEAVMEPQLSAPAPKRRLMESKRIRKISPLGMRVVVKIIRDYDMTEGGLYLPEGSKQSMAESLLAEVIEVASAMDEHSDEETNVSGIPLGAHVLIPKDGGVKIPWDEQLRIIESKYILALVNEMNIT